MSCVSLYGLCEGVVIQVWSLVPVQRDSVAKGQSQGARNHVELCTGTLAVSGIYLKVKATAT